MEVSFYQQSFGAYIPNTHSIQKLKFYLDKQYIEGFPTPNYNKLCKNINELLPRKEDLVIFDKVYNDAKADNYINIIGEIRRKGILSVFLAKINLNDKPVKMNKEILQAIKNGLNRTNNI